MTEGESEGRQSSTFTDVTVELANIGGIDAASLALDDGVTVFTGQNATNRTSLLRGIAGALGGTAGVLKRDADSGQASVTIDDQQYTRRYTREGESVRGFGTPYTDDSELVDLFVCLLEDNPIRRAVRAGADLSEHLLAPVDTEELESRANRLQSERDRVDDQLAEIEDERKRLPHLEERRTKLRTELEEIESELETVRENVESTEQASEDGQAAELLTELKEKQTELERTESEIETQRSIREELQADLRDVREELDELDLEESERSELEQEIERLQGREAELSATVNELSTILKQNRELLDGGDSALDELVVDETTSELDPMSRSIECWTCGSEIEHIAIADRLEDIETLVEEKRDELKELRGTLSEVRSRRDTLERDVERHRRLEEREADLERELEQCEETIETLTAKTDRLREEVAELRTEVESMDAVDDDETVGEYERLSDLEYERGRLERELADVQDDIDEIEYLVGKRDELEANRVDLSEQIASLRSRAEELEKAAVETFNTHMEAVLERLEYENVVRIWIEWRKEGGETVFDLHVVREDESGRVYEDAVDHLSESEREVVGLVVALAGYLTHDVQDVLPVVLLDSLESIDAPRIAELVEYFRLHTDYLLIALLDEDAASLPESYNYVAAEEHLTSDCS